MVSIDTFDSGITITHIYGVVSVADIRHHNVFRKAVGHFFEPDLYLVKGILFFVFRKIQFRVCIVMIKDVFNPQKLKQERNKENIVWRVATLNDVESAAQIDPPRVDKLPKQSTTVLV